MAEYDFLYTGVRQTDKVVALLDADIIAVKSAAIFEAQDGHEEDHLFMFVRKTIKEWTQACGADEYRICLSKGRSFRYDAYPQYKSNRTGSKPRGTDEAKAFLRENYKVLEWDTLEADDVMGILATEPDTKEKRVIVSTDKDMLQIPAWQFNPDRDRWPHKPTEDAAWAFYLYQTMCGDSGDGYPGIPYFGVSRFKRVLERSETECIGNVEVFDEWDLSMDYLKSQEICARILRWGDQPEGWDL